jgi:hypothetical protein
MALADPLVTVEELSTFMRTTFASGPERDQAYLVLKVVSAYVRTLGQKNWNNTDLLPPGDVVGVVLSASRRELTNPDRIISESMGPISVTRQVPPDGFFTRGEMAIIRKKSSGSMYTIPFRREDDRWAVGYIHMTYDLSDEPFPYFDQWDPGYWGTIHP